MNKTLRQCEFSPDSFFLSTQRVTRATLYKTISTKTLSLLYDRSGLSENTDSLFVDLSLSLPVSMVSGKYVDSVQYS